MGAGVLLAANSLARFGEINPNQVLPVFFQRSAMLEADIFLNTHGITDSSVLEREKSGPEIAVLTSEFLKECIYSRLPIRQGVLSGELQKPEAGLRICLTKISFHA